MILLSILLFDSARIFSIPPCTFLAILYVQVQIILFALFSYSSNTFSFCVAFCFCRFFLSTTRIFFSRSFLCYPQIQNFPFLRISCLKLYFLSIPRMLFSTHTHILTSALQCPAYRVSYHLFDFRTCQC